MGRPGSPGSQQRLEATWSSAHLRTQHDHPAGEPGTGARGLGAGYTVQREHPGAGTIHLRFTHAISYQRLSRLFLHLFALQISEGA